VEVGVFGCPPRPEVLERYREAGVRRCVLGLPPARADVVLPVLDDFARLLGEV
jgi:hypothetical protein